jgi:hypothetical protein
MRQGIFCDRGLRQFRNKPFYRRRSIAEKGFGCFCPGRSRMRTEVQESKRLGRACLPSVQHGFFRRITSRSSLATANSAPGRAPIGSNESCASVANRRCSLSGKNENGKTPAVVGAGSPPALELDHIVPRFDGGKATREYSDALAGVTTRSFGKKTIRFTSNS